MVIGAQLYTVREFTQNEMDFEESIKKIAEIGYTCVQISAVGDIAPVRLREICDKYNIKIILTHTNPSRVLNDTEAVIDEHKVMGASYIGIGSMPGEYMGTNPKKFISDYTIPAQKIKEAGLKFMYHNHNFEFEKIDGKLIIDYLAEGFDPSLMGFVLDTYWVQAGGAAPAMYIRKFKGRLETIHLKDMQIIPKTPGSWIVSQAMAPVMEGNLNWDEIFEACKESDVQYAFIEQDDCNGLDPFACLAVSYNNLKEFY